MFYYAIRGLTRVFAGHYLSLKVTGAGHVPSKGAFILAANHSSYLDAPLLSAAVPRAVRFIMRDKLLEFPLLGFVLKHAGAIPIKRRGMDLGAMKKALLTLKKGGVIGIFPEGTRSKNRQLKKAKSGIGALAAKAGVPVLPVYIDGAFDAMPRRVRTFKRHPVKVHIGRPVSFGDEYGDRKDRDRYARIADGIMREILKVKDAHAASGRKH